MPFAKELFTASSDFEFPAEVGTNSGKHVQLAIPGNCRQFLAPLVHPARVQLAWPDIIEPAKGDLFRTRHPHPHINVIGNCNPTSARVGPLRVEARTMPHSASVSVRSDER